MDEKIIDEVTRLKVEVLDALSETLNDYVEVQKDNHEALGHRDESAGQECYNQFTPGDFRDMIDDAARQVGVYGYRSKRAIPITACPMPRCTATSQDMAAHMAERHSDGTTDWPAFARALLGIES